MSKASIANNIGMKFGKLTLIEYLGNSPNSTFLAKCDCGGTKVVKWNIFKRGDVKSCGCTPVSEEYLDRNKGKKFGKLTAIERLDYKNGNGCYMWKFLCDCGNETIRDIGSVAFYNKSTCEECRLNKMADRSRTHGKSNTKEHSTWSRITQRCYNEKDHSYKEYGGLGITFDYKDDFEGFLAEVGECPKDGKSYSIDRIDNNKGYVKGNMQWATNTQQARNKGKMRNNTSGFAGVVWDNKEHPCGGKFTLYAAAQWHDLTGKIKKKAFSVKKYGLLEAFALACRYRENIIAELNKQGAGYSDNHGKPKEIV